MREAASFIASRSNPTSAGLLPILARAAVHLQRAWARRRDLARLREFDDHQLADIGVTREDLRWALTQPFLHDPTAALQHRALRNRARGWRG